MNEQLLANKHSALDGVHSDGEASRDLPVLQRDIERLSQTEEFEDWSRQQLARLLPYIQKYQVAPGEKLFQQGESAEQYYVLLTGSVLLTSSTGECQTLSEGVVGKEALLGVNGYLSEVVVLESSIFLAIPSDKAHEIAPEHTASKDMFRKVLLEQVHTPAALDAQQELLEVPEVDTQYKDWFKALGWLLVVLTPACILYFGEQGGDALLNWRQKQFIAAFSVTLIMWVFQLIPMYAAGLFTLIICLSLGVVPSEVALSGYASGSFFMALSIFGLGSVLVASGATYRVVLWILQRCPNSTFSYNFSLLLLGIFLTPMIPSSNGRVGLLSPMLVDMSKSLGFKNGSAAATRLSLSMFAGVSIFSAIFMTSKSLNLLVFSLLPVQRREEFQWMNWFTAASVAGLVMLTLFLVCSHFMFKHSEKPKISKQDIKDQLAMLGPITSLEWFALCGVLFFLLAVVTASFHKIQLSWVSLTVLFVFLALGMISNKQIKNDIDWRFLILLGSMIGMVHILNYTQIDVLLSERLNLVGVFMAQDFEFFVLILIGIVFALRLFLPINAAGMLTAAIFIPLAESHGIDPWVVAFIILMLAECWLFPYQASYFVMFQGVVQKKAKLYNHASFLKFNALSVLFRIVAIYCTLPFFRWLNML
ncbi:SLC13 family permease [Pseudoalteromonas luteoviolacea]|uniref:Di-and tricarboxylate transporter n=1 Tax=Pseudoalteromonas luteoviolacea (strain 2ta16) TaxID=1353533 RepID=V4H553_PSEL2|nr:SLC13 family permease [Pseudoalteromonas luteoviolacea]ESP92631.1 Di- and tricarboxylate transporter [Pseudoalteromonas luteoviolacea 2ta16]KZN35439.1 hypothetical protein N483_00375 [Pseudoalteromonas luteoviolacea NCIMB 1944]